MMKGFLEQVVVGVGGFLVVAVSQCAIGIPGYLNIQEGNRTRLLLFRGEFDAGFLLEEVPDKLLSCVGTVWPHEERVTDEVNPSITPMICFEKV